MNWFRRIFSRSSAFRRTGRQRPYTFSSRIPGGLGIREELAEAASGLLHRQEKAWNTAYMRQVRDRVLSRRPEMGPDRYGWMELELRRFFLLTSLVRNVPMFSDDADLIWHEMLMFTREYQRFCDEFAGFYIHHQPNVIAGNPEASAQEKRERDLFELLYVSLFDLYPENRKLLGDFYRRPMDPALTEELRTMDPARVRAELRFRETADAGAGALQAGIISVILEQTEQARFYHSDRQSNRNTSYHRGMDPLWTILAFGMATSISPFHPGQEMEGEPRRESGSACSGYHAGSDNGSDGNGSSDGSSDGGGGSSCGSGCGGN